MPAIFNIGRSFKANMAKIQEDRVNVEKAMFLSHTFHFLLASGKACLFPFLTVYFRLLGLSATQVGIIFGAQAVIKLWAAPMWTACAKACRKKKVILMFSTFILLATSLCLSLAPPADIDTSPLYCRAPLPNSSATVLNNGSPPHLPATHTLTTTTLASKDQNSGLADGIEKDVQPDTSPLAPESASEPTTTTKAVLKLTPSISKQPSTTTTTTTMSSSTTTTTLTTTATTTESTTTSKLETTNKHKSHHNGKNKNKEDKLDTEEINDLLAQMKELGFSDDSINNLSDSELEDLLSSLLAEDDKDQSKKTGPFDSTNSQGDNYNGYDDSNYQYDSYNRANTRSNWSGNQRHKRSALNSFESTWSDFSKKLDVREYRTFILILALIIAGEFFAAPVEKLADDCWFEYLDILDVLEKYGQHKIWKTIGYVLLPAFVGTIIEKTPCVIMHSVPHFMIHFFMFAGFTGLAFMIAFGFPMSQNKKTPKQSRFAKGVRILCCDIHCMTFTITIFLLAVCYACIQNFLFWKVLDIGGSEIVLGVSIAVSALSATFMHLIKVPFIKRITHVGATVLAMITLAARLVFYSFLWTPWMVLAGEILHGLSYTLLWGAVQSFPDFRINPFIMDRSAYTLLNVIYSGLGYGIGSALSGILYDQFGFALLFQGACVLITSWCGLFLILQKCIKRKTKVRYAKLLQDDHGDDTSTDDEDWLEVAMKSG